jgi:hypothetical protein
MTEKNTPTRTKPKATTRRSSLSIPDTYAKVLYEKYDAENPKRDDGRKMPFGEWLGSIAVAKLTEGNPKLARSIVAQGGPEVEEAAARGAAIGVARNLEKFAVELGHVIAERLIEIEDRIERMEGVLAQGQALTERLMALEERLSGTERASVGGEATR